MSGAEGGADVTAKAVYLRCFTTKIAAEPEGRAPGRRRDSYMVIPEQNYAISQPRDNARPRSPALRRGEGNRAESPACGRRITAPADQRHHPACRRRRAGGRAAGDPAARLSRVLVWLAPSDRAARPGRAAGAGARPAR